MQSRTGSYRPIAQPRPGFEVVGGPASTCVGGDASRCLYLPRGVMGQLARQVGWGLYTESNGVEQGGLLVGHAYEDAAAGIVYGIAAAAVQGQPARASGSYLELGHEAWKAMLECVDQLAARRVDETLRVIGWYHTHLDRLPVRMSDIDRATQARLFAHDWQFALVLNPHRRAWGVFFGSEAAACHGFVVAEVAGQ